MLLLLPRLRRGSTIAVLRLSASLSFPVFLPSFPYLSRPPLSRMRMRVRIHPPLGRTVGVWGVLGHLREAARRKAANAKAIVGGSSGLPDLNRLAAALVIAPRRMVRGEDSLGYILKYGGGSGQQQDEYAG